MYFQSVLFGQAYIEIPIVEINSVDSVGINLCPIHPNQGELF